MLKMRLRSVSRRAFLAVCCTAALAVLLIAGDSSAQTGPDVTVFSFTDIGNYGASGGFLGYSIGTVSCNRGTKPLNWCDQNSGCADGATTSDHPVIAQNLYRLKGGRFEQIGMSWLKHGFVSTNSTTGGCTGAGGQSCQSPPAGGNQLGVGCTDPYTSSLNGSRPLGRRSEVNATTAAFPFPPASPGGPYQVYDQRIKVAMPDVDPAQNAGATYWAEAQYVAPDDAVAGNGLNNASHRRVLPGAAPSYPLSMSGSFFERQPAIYAWKLQDPSVTLVNVDVPGAVAQRFHVGRTVTDLGGGVWHYEFAIHNLNSDRGSRAFQVEIPGTVNFSNAGFKDVENHSGEPYDTTDWTVSSSGNVLSWATNTFANDQNANALRWATLYNFWFDADQPPTGAIGYTLDLFKPGDPAAVVFHIGDDLFADGFETGGTTRWTGSGS